MGQHLPESLGCPVQGLNVKSCGRLQSNHPRSPGRGRWRLLGILERVFYRYRGRQPRHLHLQRHGQGLCAVQYWYQGRDRPQ